MPAGFIHPTLGRLAAQIASAGYKPEQVDDILITHMHLTTLAGCRPRANWLSPTPPFTSTRRIVTSGCPRPIWTRPRPTKGLFPGCPGFLSAYETAGKLKTFNADGEVVPGIRSQATHGHTAGHAIYLVESQSKRLALIGDLIHVASVQLESPQITIGFDSDEKQARAQRLKTFQQLAKEGSLVGAAHFPSPAWAACAAPEGLCLGSRELQQPGQGCARPQAPSKLSNDARPVLPMDHPDQSGTHLAVVAEACISPTYWWRWNCLCRSALVVAQAQGIGPALGKAASATSHFCQRDRRHLDRVPVRRGRGSGD